MKRPAPWQARRIATAKALRALPKCDRCGAKPGYGMTPEEEWLCTSCAVDRFETQRAKKRADAPRET